MNKKVAVNVLKGVPALPAKELVEKFLNGTLALTDNNCKS